MKKLVILLMVALLLPVAAAFAGAHVKIPGTGIKPAPPFSPPPPPAVGPIVSKGPVRMVCSLSNTHILEGSDGETFLQITLAADNIISERRLPMNLGLVIDRSGSMASQNKLEFAKQAAKFLIKNLSPEDRVALVIYDDNVAVLQPSVRVGEREELLATIDSIRPGGSTNLSGGMFAGVEQVKEFLADEQINRVLLLSDGLANRGIVDRNMLNRFAREACSRGISITTLGVGVDYNEDLMLDLAEYSGGNYYYIDNPDSMSRIFEAELNELLQVIAQSPTLTIELGPDVRLSEVCGYKYEFKENKVVVSLGDIYAGEKRKLVAQLAIPTSRADGIEVAKVCLNYNDVTKDSERITMASLVKATVTEDSSKVAKNKNMNVLEKVESNKAAAALQKAIRFFESGRKAEAEKILGDQIEKSKEMNETHFRSDALDAQIREMDEAYSTLSAPISSGSCEGKDFRKRQKLNAYEYMQN